MDNSVKPQEWEILPICEDIGLGTATQLVLKRRAPRVDVEHYNPTVTIGHFGTQLKLFRIKNVAEFGASFFLDGMDLRREVGHPYQTSLRIGDLEIPVIARLLYLSENLGGLEFVSPSDQARLSIRTHFFFELIAAALFPVSQAVGLDDDGSTRIVYADESEAHGLVLHHRKGQLEGFDFNLGFIGTQVKWRPRSLIQVCTTSGENLEIAYIRNQLVGFLRNLRGLNPRMAKLIETICTREQFEFRGDL